MDFPIPIPILAHTLGYTRFPSLSVLRLVCRRFRQVLDDKNIFDKMYVENCSPLVPRLLFGNSIGTTSLKICASKKEKCCISCGLWFNLKMNIFYDILLCDKCSRKYIFRVVTLRRACFNYFLDYEVQKENKSLVKVKHGRSFRTLLHHVRKIAVNKYPHGQLEEKMNERFARAYQTEINKQQQRERRIREISYKFCDVLWEAPSRVDSILHDQEALKDLVHRFGSLTDVFGDTLEHKVRSCTKTGGAAKRLYNYGAMLTFMRKLELLDHKYDITFGHRCVPTNIFRIHSTGGLHFYELSREHADARKEFMSRCHEVETYLVRMGHVDKPWRKSLSVAMCAEDSIDYVAQDFENFVNSQEGNPVEIARQVRERKFLYQNNLAWEINSFTSRGYDQEASRRMAVANVLHYTKGYPPMKRACYINLSPNPT